MLKQPPTDDNDIWWIIDPIDGTRNFAHGVPIYAVSIGVIQNGLPVVGVIYDPNTDNMFSAQKGGPAKCNGRTIHTRNETLNKNSQLAVSGNFIRFMGPNAEPIMEQFTCVNLGSAALHFAYVALGAFSAAFAWEVKLWDIAAGAVICPAADATVIDMRGNPRFPIDCTGYEGQSIPLVITHKSVIGQLEQYLFHN